MFMGPVGIVLVRVVYSNVKIVRLHGFCQNCVGVVTIEWDWLDERGSFYKLVRVAWVLLALCECVSVFWGLVSIEWVCESGVGPS